MVNIKHKIIFLLVFLSFGCASVDDVESKSLIERGLEELSNFNGQNQDINEKRVDGLPLIIVLSLNGINEAYIREYESKGGGYNFPDYFLNALCVEDKFDDALYFIHDKKMEISP